LADLVAIMLPRSRNSEVDESPVQQSNRVFDRRRAQGM